MLQKKSAAINHQTCFMRIAIALILFITAISTDIRSQGILLLPRQTEDSSKQQHTDVIVIKGDDIRRFPAIDFMEAVHGLFPWAFTQDADPNNFLFVVNGFVLPDINSISLNDIEEIIFTRNNLYGTLFPFSRAGTFIITTKVAKGKKTLVNFNSQYNAVWNKKGFLPGPFFGLPSSIKTRSNESDNKAGHYWSNHLSISFGGKKLKGYISAQANSQRFAEIRQYTIFDLGAPQFADTVNSASKARVTSQRAFMNLTYKLSKKIDIGATADYSHFSYSNQFGYTSFAYSNRWQTSRQTKDPLNYYHAGVFMNYRILKNLVNTVWFEHGFEKMAWESSSTSQALPGGTFPLFTGMSTTKPRTKSFVVRDQLLYNLLSKGKFTTDVSLTFAYIRSNLNVESYVQSGSAFSFYKSQLKEKIANLNPLVNFSYNKLISGYFGAAILVGKKSFQNVEEKDKSSFYSGIEVDFIQLIKTRKAISSLLLSVNYGDLPKNFSNNYWLNLSYVANGYFPRGRFEATAITGNPFQSGNVTLSRNKLLSFNLSSTFLDDRLQVITEWSQLKTESIFYYYVTPPNIYIPVRGVETVEGFSAAFAGKIIDRSKFKLRSGLNFVFPKGKFDHAATATGAFSTLSSMKAGWQNRLDYKNFFFQLNVLAEINRVYAFYYSPGVYPTFEKHNDFSINYLVIGYETHLSKRSAFKDMAVFLQAKNLYATKQLRSIYQFDHYGGLGVNLNF